MATIGHTLVGLSLAGLAGAESRGGAMRRTWLGFMALAGHLVDIVEWGIVIVAPKYFDHHYVTNSPVLTAGISAAVCLGLAVFAKLRSLRAYALVVLAIYSHLLLDSQLMKTFVAEAYGRWIEGENADLYQSAFGEIWFYGLPLLCVSLVQASRRRDCPRRGRAAAIALIAIVILAAITRVAAIWAPVYGLAALHVLLLSRREIKPAILWNLVPPIPVFALLAVELWAGYLYGQGVSLENQRAYPAASAMYKRALAWPTRSTKVGCYFHLGECLRREGLLASAEAAFLRASMIADQSFLAQSKLARFYAHSNVRGTPFFQPDKARRLLQELLVGGSPPEIASYARQLLKQLDERGYVE